MTPDPEIHAFMGTSRQFDDVVRGTEWDQALAARLRFAAPRTRKIAGIENANSLAGLRRGVDWNCTVRHGSACDGRNCVAQRLERSMDQCRAGTKRSSIGINTADNAYSIPGDLDL